MMDANHPIIIEEGSFGKRNKNQHKYSTPSFAATKKICYFNKNSKVVISVKNKKCALKKSIYRLNLKEKIYQSESLLLSSSSVSSSSGIGNLRMAATPVNWASSK
jgi:hypothetical protein